MGEILQTLLQSHSYKKYRLRYLPAFIKWLQAFMIPLNPFRFTRKHHNYANYNKNIISVFTFMLHGLTPKKIHCQIVKLLQVFMLPPPPDFVIVIFSQIKKYRLKFIFAVNYMLLHIRQITPNYTKKDTLPNFKSCYWHLWHHSTPNIG